MDIVDDPIRVVRRADVYTSDDFKRVAGPITDVESDARNDLCSQGEPNKCTDETQRGVPSPAVEMDLHFTMTMVLI